MENKRNRLRRQNCVCDKRERQSKEMLSVIRPIMVHVDVGTGECIKKHTGRNLRKDTLKGDS